MESIVEFIDDALRNSENDAALEKIHKEVKVFMKKFPLYD
jgi:glycine/serine hydroxymethyltransferase